MARPMAVATAMARRAVAGVAAVARWARARGRQATLAASGAVLRAVQEAQGTLPAAPHQRARLDSAAAAAAVAAPDRPQQQAPQAAAADTAAAAAGAVPMAHPRAM